MLRKIKYSKVAVVVFLTGLIWIWADLAVVKTYPVSNVTLGVAKSTDPKFWVVFCEPNAPIDNYKPLATIEEIELRGPQSKIAEVSRKVEDNLLSFEFFLNLAEEKMDKPGDHSLPLLQFLQKDKTIKGFGLLVESCKPEDLPVKVIGLVEKALSLQCINEAGNILQAQSIEPTTVNMFVPGDWGRDKLTARIDLTRSEIEQARTKPVEKTPYIELAPGQTRQASTVVMVKMPPEEDPRTIYTITTPKLGIAMSTTLLGNYTVEVENLADVVRPISIKAIPEARRAYEEMRYHVILEIDDKDAQSAGTIPRELIYNFPPEFSGTGQIILDPDQPRVTARLKLTRLPSAEAP
ncbi:MAG: hypothetical protein ABIF19_02170 [Planctomycetota bacterium]